MALTVADLEIDDEAVPVRVLVAVRVLVGLLVPVRVVVMLFVARAVADEDREVVEDRVDVCEMNGDHVATALRVLLGEGRVDCVSRAVRVDVRVDVADRVGSAAMSASSRRFQETESYRRATATSSYGSAATPLNMPAPPGENDIRLSIKRRSRMFVLDPQDFYRPAATHRMNRTKMAATHQKCAGSCRRSTTTRMA